MRLIGLTSITLPYSLGVGMSAFYVYAIRTRSWFASPPEQTPQRTGALGFMDTVADWSIGLKDLAFFGLFASGGIFVVCLLGQGLIHSFVSSDSAPFKTIKRVLKFGEFFLTHLVTSAHVMQSERDHSGQSACSPTSHFSGPASWSSSYLSSPLGA